MGILRHVRKVPRARDSGGCIPVIVVARRILHAQLRKTVFPYRLFGLKAEGKTPFDELHSLLDGDVRRGGEEEMEVVRHEHESVDLISTLRSILIQQLEKELGVGFDLKKPAAIRTFELAHA